jgi:hypothetical protein
MKEKLEELNNKQNKETVTNVKNRHTNTVYCTEQEQNLTEIEITTVAF